MKKTLESLTRDNSVAIGSINELLSRRYTVTELACGQVNNRLQACVNLLHLLGTDGGLNEQAQLLVTHLQSEIALLRSILRHSIEPVSATRAIEATP